MKLTTDILGLTLLEQLLVLSIALSLLTVSVRHFVYYVEWQTRRLFQHDIAALQWQARDYFYQQGCDPGSGFRGNLQPSVTQLHLSQLKQGRAPWIRAYRVNFDTPPMHTHATCQRWLRVIAEPTPQGMFHVAHLLTMVPGGERIGNQLQWHTLLTAKPALTLNPLPVSMAA